VRRRQRLIVEYVDRDAGDAFVRQQADQRVLVDDRPRDALINRAVGFILSSSAAPTGASRPTLLNDRTKVNIMIKEGLPALGIVAPCRAARSRSSTNVVRYK
jgi:hypothetical protein